MDTEIWGRRERESRKGDIFQNIRDALDIKFISPI